MKNFTNISSSGNERALRRGTRVPDGDINLAWVKSPKLTAENNIIILDTSRTIDENRVDYSTTTQLMYANSLGILEDENGNQVIEDEYPCIADVFLQDEDFSLVAGNEYTNDDPLPLVHVSRYFHLDFDKGVLYCHPHMGERKMAIYIRSRLESRVQKIRCVG